MTLVLSFIQTVYDLYYLETGHPIWMVTVSLDMLLLIIFWILIKKGKSAYCYLGAITYFFCHAFSAVCVYKEWLPEPWTSYSKYGLENSILMTFIAVNSIPLSDFKQTAFITFPLFMATSYAQIKAERSFMVQEYLKIQSEPSLTTLVAALRNPDE